METLAGKIQFRTRRRVLIPGALFRHFYMLLDLQFLDFYVSGSGHSQREVKLIFFHTFVPDWSHHP
jgi:hypothetical protein